MKWMTLWLLVAGGFASAASISGSYIGNGSSQTINVGFQPDVVIVKDEIAPAAGTSSGIQIRTSTMSFTKHFGQTAAGSTGTDRITAITSNGFTVGVSTTVNASGVKYCYLALKEAAGEIKVGSYSGDGTDNRNITGVGFQPDFVMAMDSTGTPAMWYSSVMPADESETLDFSPGPNYIQSLLADGFQVGSDTRVNASGGSHHYIACKNVAGKFKVGSYVGDGTTPRPFVGMGFRPEGLFIKRNSTTVGNIRFNSTGASTTADITLQPNASTYTTNAILSLDNDGFTIGNSGNRINGTTAPNTYYWFAFANVAAASSGPAVTSVSPVSGPTSGGQKLTITGTGFTGATGVTIGGTPANAVTVVNDTTITCGTPAHAAGVNQTVVVATPGGSSNPALYSYYAATVVDFETVTTGLPSGSTFVNSDGTWSLSAFLVDGSVNSLGSSPVAAATPASNKYLDTGINVARTASAGGTSVGAINAPAGKTFKAVAVDIWPSKDAGSNVIPYGPASGDNQPGETGHTFRVKGFLSSVEIVNVTVTDTLRFPPQSGSVPGGYWHNLDLSGTAFATTSIDKLEFFLVTQSGNATDGPNAGSPLSTPNYFALDNFIYKDLAVSAPPPPTVTSVTSTTANGSYHATQSIDISVVFSVPVTVTGAPQITLETGTIDRTVAYQIGSGTNTLHFTHSIQSGDTSPDLDYVSTSALALAGGTINATTGGTPAVLTLPAPGAAGSLGANKDIVIDTTPPTVQSVTRLTPSGQNTNATTVTFRVTYSEPVTLTIPATTHFQVVPVNGSNITGTVQSVSGSGSTRDVQVNITGGTGEFRLRVVD